MRALGAVVSVLVLAFLPSQALAQELFRYCKAYQAPSGSSSGMTVDLEGKGKGEGPASREAVTAVIAKGEAPEVSIYCDFDYRAARGVLGLKENEARTWDVSVGGARKVMSPQHQEQWFVPVKEGENTVIVRRRANPAGKEVSRTLTFPAFVYTLEPAGQLTRPFPESAKPRIAQHYLDASGQLYVMWEGYDDARPQGRKNLRALVRYGPGGQITLRYLLGKGEILESPEAIRVLTVDAGGSLWAIVNRNVVQFDRAGRFVKSVLAFGGSEPIRSADQIHDHKGSQALRARQGDLGRLHDVAGGYNPAIAEAGGAVLFVAYAEGSALAWVRLTLDGKASVHTLDLPNRHIDGLLAGADGNPHLGTYVQGRQNGVRVYSPDARLLREFPLPQGAAIGLKAVAGDGSLYTGRSCGTRVLRDLSAHGNTDMSGYRVSGAWRPDPARAGSGTWVYTDRLTGTTSTGRIPGTEGVRCWLDPQGAVLVLYEDLRVGRFIPASATGAVARAAPAASEGGAARLRLAWGQAATEDVPSAIALDGARIFFGAQLTDAQGKPMAGVSAQLSVVEPPRGGKGSPGEFTQWKGGATDAQGRVYGIYKTPRMAAEWEPGPMSFLFRVTASPPGVAPVEESVGLVGMGLVQGVVRISRVGYAPVTTQVPVASLKAGVLTGTVVHRDVRDGATRREIPVIRARVELLESATAKIPLAAGESDRQGYFKIDVAPGAAPGFRPVSEVDPRALAFTSLDADTTDILGDYARVLGALKAPGRDYQVNALERQVQTRFLERLAAASDETAARQELGRLKRVGLFVAAAFAADGLVDDAASRIVDAVADLVGDAIDLLDPAAPRFAALESKTRQAVIYLYDKTPLRKHLANATISSIVKALGTLGHEGPWAMLIRQRLTEALLGGGPVKPLNEFRNGTRRAFLGVHRGDTQRLLDRAAALWEAGRVPADPAGRDIVVARYREMAEYRQRTSARQLDVDEIKAAGKLITDTLGNTVKIVAVATLDPLLARSEELVEKIQRASNMVLDLAQTKTWVDDLNFGRFQTQQLFAAAFGVGE